MRVVFKATGQTGTIPDENFDPNMFDPVYDDAPSQPMSQPSQGFDIGGAASKVGSSIKGAYDFLKPQAYASMVEPVAEATVRTIPQAVSLAKTYMGKPLTREELKSGNAYVKKINPLMKTIKEKYSNPWNYGGAAAEIALLKGASGLQNKLFGSLGGQAGVHSAGNLLPWLGSRAGTGAATGFAYGASRPEEGGDIGKRIQKGAELAPGAAMSNVAISGLFDAIPALSGILKNESVDMYNRMNPIDLGDDLRNVADKRRLGQKALDTVKSNTRENMVQDVQNKIEKLKGSKNELFSKSKDTLISEDDLTSKFQNVLDDFTTGDGKEDKILSAQYSKALKKLTQGFDQVDSGGVTAAKTISIPRDNFITDAAGKKMVFDPSKRSIQELMPSDAKRLTNISGISEDIKKQAQEFFTKNPKATSFKATLPLKAANVQYGSQGTAASLMQGKEELKKFMDTTGASERLKGYKGTPADHMLATMYKQANSMIDDLSGQNLSTIGKEQSDLIKIGQAIAAPLDKAAGGPSFQSTMKGIPFFNLLTRYIEGLETGALRGANKLGKTGQNINQNKAYQALSKILPNLLLQAQTNQQMKSPVPQPTPYMQPNSVYDDEEIMNN